MHNKEFVVVTKAVRPYIIGNKEVKRPYRCGRIGLLYLPILEHYDEENRRLPEFPLFFRDRIPLTRSDISPSFLPLIKEEYIPVLMHNRRLPDSNKYFFIALLKADELHKIKGTDWSSVKEGLKGIFTDNEMLDNPSDLLFEETIKPQWEYLDRFNLSIPERVTKIPLEVSYVNLKGAKPSAPGA